VKRLFLSSVVLSLLLLACGSVNPAPSDIDDVALSAGMTPLAGMPLPEGKEEIRLWLSTGIVLPNQMLRLTHVRDRWLGEVWRYWPRGEAEQLLPVGRESYEEVMERCGCVRTLRGSRNVACRVGEEKAIDWESVARRLGQLDVAALSSGAGRDDHGGSGDVLDIEYRSASSYHRARYANFRGSNSARHAGEIVQMMKDLDAMNRCDR
jgi:hypothetical protein